MTERVKIEIPYGKKQLEAYMPQNNFIFEGKIQTRKPLCDFEKTLGEKLDHPIGCRSLKEEVLGKARILIIVEDNTRNTPVKRILPVLLRYLGEAGIPTAKIEILIAPGTHRAMSEEEIIDKIGVGIYQKVRIFQHDYTDKSAMRDLGVIRAGGRDIPIQVNKKALEADYIIGLGNIIPHSDAGFSGGAKIVQPGICYATTTSATHIMGALLDEIPLGNVENPCRQGIEMVAKKVGLKFIINVVMNPENEVVDIFTGDFIRAHREGARVSREVYGVKIPELADIVVVSSCPCDIDYWQADKGLIAAYFAVKKGGYIIFVAPCYEGMEHNHPKLRDWARLSLTEALALAEKTPFSDEEADLVAADIAIQGIRVREKVKKVLIITDGLTQEEIDILGFAKSETLQGALDEVLKRVPNGRVGVLPRGGDCLPVMR